MPYGIHSQTTTRGRRPRLAPLVVAVACALVPPTSSTAQDSLSPKVSFDAFGTIGLAHSLEGSADFVENPTRGEGTGHTHAFDPSLDSRFAGQVTLEAGPKMTGVVQVLVETDTHGDYKPILEWANLRYSFTPDLSVRAGRIVLPMFLVSEARKVSFANPWARPPVELYGMIPIYSWDGVDASYRRRLGDWTGSMNGAVGRAESEIPGGHAEADRFWTVNGSLQRGEFTGRFAIASGRVGIDAYEPLFDGFRGFGPEGEAIVERYDVVDRPLWFSAAGSEYARGAWFALTELGWMRSESAMGERIAGYVTAGYRAGAFTPFATFSRTDLLSESSTPGLTLAGLPAEYAQAAAQLNAGLNLALQSSPEQQTLAIGGRWDVRTGVALKAQVDFVDMLETSNGTFRNVQPTFEPGGNAQLLSVSASFVF